MPPAPKIPRAQLRPGATNCLRVAQDRLAEASGLLETPGFQAAIVFSFAVEEFGKAVLLRDAYEATLDDPVTVPGFYDHSTKLAAAAACIQRDRFLADAVGVGTPLDLATRLSALYVEWTPGGWRHGVYFPRDEIARSITAVERVMFEAKLRWHAADEEP
jgi:hypothetical protein